MMDYMCRELGVGEEMAIALRRSYLRRYGATLLGMMRHHGTNPRHFLAHTHDLPDLQQMVVCERGLSRVLARLPGRKLLFSMRRQRTRMRCWRHAESTGVLMVSTRLKIFGSHPSPH